MTIALGVGQELVGKLQYLDMGFNKGISHFRVRGAGNYVRQKAYGFIDSPSPANISTLHGWWSADFGVTSDAGNNISQVNDRSGNGRHATQVVGANQPTFVADGGAIFNNRPVMRFNGLTHFLSIADFDYVDYNNLNIFIVFRSNDFTTAGSLLSHGGLPGDLAWNTFINSTTNVRVNISEDGTLLPKQSNLSTVLVTTDAYVYSFRFNTTTLRTFLNGVDDTSIVLNDPMTRFYDATLGLRIGALNFFGAPFVFFDGDMPEIVIAGDMTDGETIGLSSYFIDKYKVKVNGI